MSALPQAPQQTTTTEQIPVENTKLASLQEAVQGKIAQVQEPVKEEPKPSVPGADRFAALARKERALQKQAAEVKAQLEELKKSQSTVTKKPSTPLEALEQSGFTYEQLTNFILNGQKPTPELAIKGIDDKFEAFRKEQEAKELAKQEAEKAAAAKQYEETLQEFSNEVSEYLKTNIDTYELTNMYDGRDIVLATIESHFEQTSKAGKPKIMSIKEASDLVEAYFEDQVKQAQKAKKFQPKQEVKTEGQSTASQGSKASSPTLNNTITSSAPSNLPAKTENDRIARAMAALSK